MDWLGRRLGIRKVPEGSLPSTKVILYSRADCPLCQEAYHTLNEHGLQPVVVDIDGDEDLRKRFDTCVPVVEIDGRIRFRGKVNPLLLRRLLRDGKSKG